MVGRTMKFGSIKHIFKRTTWGYEIRELGVVLAASRTTLVGAMETKPLASRQLLEIFGWGSVSTGSGAVHSVTDVPIPPLIEFCCSGLPLQCLIRFEKVDDELVELLVVEAIVIAHPLGGVSESEMQLSKCVSVEILTKEAVYLYSCIGNCPGGYLTVHL